MVTDDLPSALSSTGNSITELINTKANFVDESMMASLMVKLYLLVGSIGISGNCIVLLLLSFSPRLKRNIPNQFIAFQSTIDIFVGILLIATTLHRPTDLPEGLAGEIVCRVWLSNGLLWACILMSLYNMLTMTVERYVAIVYSFWHSIHVTRFRAAIFVFVFMLLLFVIMMINPVITCAVINGQCSLYTEQISELWGYIFSFWILLFILVFPILLMIFCYARIWCELSISQTQASATPNGAERVTTAQRNVIRTILFVNIAYVLCVSMNVVMVFKNELFGGIDFAGIPYNISVILVFLNSSINPFLYCLSYKPFQQALKMCFVVDA